MNRPLVDDMQIAQAETDVKIHLAQVLQKKGFGTLASRHEILGVMTEEYNELIQAVQSKETTSLEKVRKELMDIAVGAIFSIACIDGMSVDW